MNMAAKVTKVSNANEGVPVLEALENKVAVDNSVKAEEKVADSAKEEKATAKKETTAKTTRKTTAKKTAAKSETKEEKAAKTADDKAAEEKKAATKSTATKTTTKKATAAKTTATTKKTTAAKTTTTKKAATTKTAAKTKEVTVVVEYNGQKIYQADLLDRVNVSLEEQGVKQSTVKKIDLYVQPETNMVYYVVNAGTKKEAEGHFSL